MEKDFADEEDPLQLGVLTNFGKVHELVIDGEHTGERIKEKCEDKYREEPDR